MFVGRWSKRAFVLVLVLLLSVIMLVLGMAFVGSRALLYQSGSRIADMAQARALAEAGLEDARVKLDKDPQFPPAGRDGQHVFSYSEDLEDVAGDMVGYYEVVVDSSHSVGPYFVRRIRSVGRVGPRQDPIAEYTIDAELDIAVFHRADPNLENPRNFQFQRWDGAQNR